MLWTHALREDPKYVYELFDSDNRLLNYTQFATKLKNCISWLEYYSLIFAIPLERVQEIEMHSGGEQVCVISKLNKLHKSKLSRSSIIYSASITNVNGVR